MRIAVLAAGMLVVAGCSSAPTSAPTLTPITPKTAARSTGSPTETTSKSPVTSAVPSTAPTSTTPIEAAIAWVAAGTPADPAGFHTATRDGATAQLGDDIAFVTPTGSAECMTEAKSDGALACLVDLTDPPAPPADIYGQWIGGWADFPGATLEVGSAHGDPGRFSRGTGAELPYGSSLKFGNYQCRADRAGLFCVNFAHLSGAKFADSGVEPLGCLRVVAHPELGIRFSC